MPDEIELPGIDSSAPAAPSTGELPGLEDTGTQSASVQDGGDQQTPPSGDAPPLDDAPASTSQNAFDRRIGQAQAREREANERANLTTQLLEKVLAGVLTPQQARQQAPDASADTEPQEKEFSTWREYNSAHTKWEVREGVRSQLEAIGRQNQQQFEQQRQFENVQRQEAAKVQLHTVVGEQMREAAKRIPELHAEVSRAHIDVPLNVEAAMVASGFAGEVALYFSRHPQVMYRLAREPDMVLGAQLSKIGHAMRAGAYSVSNAPPPGNASGGNRGTGPSEYPKNATPEQHLAWRTRNARQPGARK